jgi:hypothetical protein
MGGTVADRLSVRLDRLWDVGDVDIPAIAEVTGNAMDKVDIVQDSNLAEAFTDVEAVGTVFQEAIGWYRTTLNVTTSNLDHAANAVKAVVADYATTDVALGEDLLREVEEYIEVRPEHAP